MDARITTLHTTTSGNLDHIREVLDLDGVMSAANRRGERWPVLRANHPTGDEALPALGQ